MKTVGIDELKRRLSSILRQVELEETVIVTRHNKPIAELAPAGSEPVHRGARFGKGNLEAALQKGTGGTYLKVLEADRHGNSENGWQGGNESI